MPKDFGGNHLAGDMYALMSMEFRAFFSGGPNADYCSRMSATLETCRSSHLFGCGVISPIPVIRQNAVVSKSR